MPRPTGNGAGTAAFAHRQRHGAPTRLRSPHLGMGRAGCADKTHRFVGYANAQRARRRGRTLGRTAPDARSRGPVYADYRRRGKGHARRHSHRRSLALFRTIEHGDAPQRLRFATRTRRARCGDARGRLSRDTALPGSPRYRVRAAAGLHREMGNLVHASGLGIQRCRLLLRALAAPCPRDSRRADRKRLGRYAHRGMDERRSGTERRRKDTCDRRGIRRPEPGSSALQRHDPAAHPLYAAGVHLVPGRVEQGIPCQIPVRHGGAGG